MEVLQANLPKINIPNAGTAVYKDECAFTFHTQVYFGIEILGIDGNVKESEGGILVDMNSFVGFSPEYASLNYKRTGNAVYLNIFKKRVPKKVDPVSNESGAPTVLGKGVKGGFFDRDSNFEFETTTAIVILPDYTRIPLPNIEIPTKVQLSVDAILASDSASTREQVTAFQLTNDFSESKYARSLVQLDNGVKISNSGWKCAKCDKTKNLWLNLSDGAILCGRPIHGSELSGNGHALAHYKETGYPLVVKLGTISADTQADVYSYAADEDDSVIDPLLEQHLFHWGIDLKEMKKTEKSVAELEVEMQHSFEWSSILENNKQLTPLYGPGYTGIHNLGNTCYMASVMQVLFTIPAFVQRYHENAQHFFETPKKDLITQDFHCQLAKFARGILSGDYSKPPTQSELDEDENRIKKLQEDAERSQKGLEVEKRAADPNDFPKYVERGVKPQMFKTLVGAGHPEFSTNRQQDSLEFFAYLLEMIARNEHARGEKDDLGQPILDPSNVFRFIMENRVQCGESSTVNYKNAPPQTFLPLPVPMDKVLNKEDVADYEEQKSAQKVLKDAGETDLPDIPVVLPHLNMLDCLARLFEPEAVEDFLSPATGNKTVAFKSAKFATFPDVLTLQINKFTHDAGWIPKKLQIKLDVPDELDLEHLRASGLQPDEVEMPQTKEEAAPVTVQAAKPQWDDNVVATLTSMDIPLIRAQRASHFTMGQGYDAAMEWVFSHGEDADIDTPLPAPTVSAASAGLSVPEDLIAQVMEMGFDRTKSIKALKSTQNDVGRAVEWLFSHTEDDGSSEVAESGASSGASQPAHQAIDLPNGSGKYKIFAFISHMGTSTMSGHYVCHILKDGKWVSFNDEKVAESQNPPREMAYLYFYKRV